MESVKRLTENLIIAAKRAYARGIQTGSGGNVSARIPGEDKMLIKASGSSLEDSAPDSFVLTDLKSIKISGAGKPSREALLHGLLYTLNPKIGAVVHVHAPYSIVWAKKHDILPRVTWHAQLKIPADLPILDIPAPMVREEDFPLVRAMFEKTPDIPAFILKDHGIVAFAGDAIDAEHTAELVEETAQIAFFELLQEKLT
jgi:L-ribulose-5-phosphate 4-epimerase